MRKAPCLANLGNMLQLLWPFIWLTSRGPLMQWDAAVSQHSMLPFRGWPDDNVPRQGNGGKGSYWSRRVWFLFFQLPLMVKWLSKWALYRLAYTLFLFTRASSRLPLPESRRISLIHCGWKLTITFKDQTYFTLWLNNCSVSLRSGVFIQTQTEVSGCFP